MRCEEEGWCEREKALRPAVNTHCASDEPVSTNVNQLCEEGAVCTSRNLHGFRKHWADQQGCKKDGYVHSRLDWRVGLRRVDPLQGRVEGRDRRVEVGWRVGWRVRWRVGWRLRWRVRWRVGK